MRRRPLSARPPRPRLKLTPAAAGTSSGLGRRLVPILLERGDKVVATARAPDTLRDAFPASANLRVQQLDVTAGAAAIRAKAEAAIAFFGRVDVVVNNAGAGWKAIIEEAGCVRRVFATLDVCALC